MNRILILDTETTGLIEPIEPIEVAFLLINYPQLEILHEFYMQYKPSKPIELGAMVTANILMEDLEGCPASIYAKGVIGKPDYIIGHNVDYDWKVLGSPAGVKRIDTKAISQWLFPKLDSHRQSAMLYHFMGVAAKEVLKEAHNALVDVKNNLKLIKYLLWYIKNNEELALHVDTIENLYLLSEEARVPKLVPFGKYRGQPFTAMAPSYVDWWLNKSDTKPDEYQLIALRKARFKV